jgi:3',5'-cyclic AMP phosphodiesterase CpdA
MKQSGLLIILVLMLAFAIAPLIGGLDPNGGATAAPDHIILTWTGDPATTITITWRCDASVASGYVQYKEGRMLSAEARQVKADARDFTTDLGASRLFTATLRNLIPNRQYSYRVGDGERWSAPCSFFTADPGTDSFKFLIFGDSQAPVRGEDPYGVWRTTVQNAFKANPDAKFMVNVGDLVDLGQNEAHWNAWFAAARGVIDQIPEMAVSGNHESYGSRDTMRPKYWVAQLPLPQNGPEGLKNQVYSYNYGPVHFVVLDSQQEEQRQYGDILGVQKSWLEADLAASKATWKIVFFHRPPYVIKPRRTNEEIKAAFCPILEKHHVDLVFSGHDHGIARTYAIKDGAIRGRPSQGTIYYIVGQSGGKTYADLEKRDMDAFFYDPQDQPNYMTVEVENKKITIKTVKQDGTLLDTFFIDKAKDLDSDMPLHSQPAEDSRKTAGMILSVQKRAAA